MNERSFGVLMALLLGLQPGCASIISSSRQDVQVRVYPEDARVIADGQPVSGGVASLTRADTHYIDVSKDGFHSKRVTVSQGLNGWFFGNLIFGPLCWIGMLVDAMNGSIYDLETNVTVSLEPMNPGAATVAQTAPPPATLQPAGPKLDDPIGKPAGPSLEGGPPKIPRTMAAGAQRDWVVAVMNTAANTRTGFDQHTLLALTDQIRVYLAERGTKVVDRSTMDAALKAIVDEEKKKSYSACVDSSCQIPLGKALAASHILRSTVARFGKACATNGELIDLRAEVTIAAGSARGDCSEEALLYAAESLAEQLVAGSQKAGL